MGIVVNNGQVCFSGRDAVSFHYHASKVGLNRFTGVFSWLFRRKVSVPESVLVNQTWPDMDATFIKSYVKSRSSISRSADYSRNLSKQQYSESCAARSLQLIADELGIKHLPENSQYMFAGQPVNDPSVETAIYAITARLLDSRGQLKPKLGGNIANGGRSALLGINNAIKALGLDGRFYCSEQTDLDESDYDRIRWERTKRLCFIHVSLPPDLRSNDRLLVIVRHYSTASDADDNSMPRQNHCVVLRPDGSCYDPYHGSNYGSLTKYSWISGMTPSGLYVLVSNNRGANKGHSCQLMG